MGRVEHFGISEGKGGGNMEAVYDWVWIFSGVTHFMNEATL